MVLDGWKGNEFGHVAFVESVAGTNRWTISHSEYWVPAMCLQSWMALMFAVVYAPGQHRVRLAFKAVGNRFRLIGFLAPRES